MALIYLAELNIATSAGVATTLYFTSGKTQTIGVNTYSAKISQPSLYGQSISLDSAVGGAISPSIGELVLTNAKRDLDIYKGYIFEGKVLSLFTYDTVSTVKTPILVQTIEQASFEWDKVSIRLQNRATLLDKPLQTLKFAGNNVLPAGVDGLTDLKDKLKPLIYGRVANMTPIMVNTAMLIYQISSGTIEQVVSVMSNGNYVTPEATMPSTYAAFTATTNPASAGKFVWYSGAEGSFIRVGMNYGTMTCTVWEKISALSNTPAQVIQRVLTLAGLTSSDWVASDFTTLDSLIADNIGIVLSDNQTVASVLTDICASIGVWWGFDSTNKIRFYYFGVGTSSLSLSTVSGTSPYGITSFDVSNASINGKLVPVKEVKLSFDKNWTVQDKASLAGIMTVNAPERVNWLGEEYRKASAVVASSLYPESQVFEYTTLLSGSIAAYAEAARVRDLLSVKRYIITMTVRLSVSDLSSLYIGKSVTVTIPRYDYTSGQVYLITAMEVDYYNSTANLTLWG